MTGGERWHESSLSLWRKLLPEARRMRRKPTAAETVLWERLRRRRLGVRFRRQHPIDRFVVDFCCLEVRLVVEVDGGIHRAEAEHDQLRDRLLAARGFRVVRVSNETVMNTPEQAVNRIQAALAEHA